MSVQYAQADGPTDGKWTHTYTDNDRRGVTSRTPRWTWTLPKLLPLNRFFLAASDANCGHVTTTRVLPLLRMHISVLAALMGIFPVRNPQAETATKYSLEMALQKLDYQDRFSIELNTNYHFKPLD